jgi:CMP-N-acetylneuraminic acid synthetase
MEGEKEKMKIVGFIPAQLCSTRLKEKNIQLLGGKPLVQHAIDFLLKDDRIEVIYVSTDRPSKILENIKPNYRVEVIKRENSLCGNTVLTEVYRDFHYKKDFDMMVITACDSMPKLSKIQLTSVISNMLQSQVQEFFTTDKNGHKRTGLHIIKSETFERNTITEYIRTYQYNVRDIHTRQELEVMENFYGVQS